MTDTYERAITAERKLRWLRAYVEAVEAMEAEPESVDLDDVISNIRTIVGPR